jgi:hypothetical protein
MKTSSLFLKLQVLLLGLSLQTLQAQDNASLQKLNLFPQQFTASNTNYPQEKVYLHIDNTAYYLGENIWFKAYVVSADQHLQSPVSKVLYVELVSAEGYVVETVKLKIENGQCHGSFRPIANYAGFYEVRAYTSYMLNFGPKNYFSRVIPVYDKPKISGDFTLQMTDRLNSQRIPDMRPVSEQKEQLEVRFFPEGGNTIIGLRSRVAIKVTGKNGENETVSGSVYNEKDEKIVDFKTEHLGMGAFEYTPTSEKQVVRIHYKNKEYKFELPASLPKGYAMHVDNSENEDIAILIQKSANMPDEQLGLCISCRGVIYNCETVDPAVKNSYTFSKQKLPSGVSQITLYNATGELLSERLIFINHHNELKMELSQTKAIYQPFEKVNIAIQVKDQQNNPIETTFSVSVRDAATSSANPFSDNILTNLLLSSEVNGYIENPGYYFQSDDLTHRQHLDLLMLTQGWSRYSWKYTGKQSFTNKYPTEKELTIEGSVVSLYAKNKMKDVDITMVLSSDSVPQYGKCKTDSAGRFSFALADFKGKANLTIQSKQNGKLKETDIKLKRNFSPDFKAYSFAEVHVPQYFNTLKDSILISGTNAIKNDSTDILPPKDNSKLTLDKKMILLTEVTVKDKRKPVKVSVKYDVANELDKRRDLGDWIPATVNTFLYFTCDYYNASTGTYKGKNVLFVRAESVIETNDDGISTSEDVLPGLRDNLRGGEMPYLDEIESISFIEDYNSIQHIYSGIIDPSSIVIALIRCKSNYRKEPYGIRNTTFSSYSYVREFYSPQYDRMLLPDERDYRRTLYWNPDVKTDKNGNAGIMFYNNSSCKTMHVNAETVTATGLIGTMNK